MGHRGVRADYALGIVDDLCAVMAMLAYLKFRWQLQKYQRARRFLFLQFKKRTDKVVDELVTSFDDLDDSDLKEAIKAGFSMIVLFSICGLL
jgi:hypothetical protein